MENFRIGDHVRITKNVFERKFDFIIGKEAIIVEKISDYMYGIIFDTDDERLSDIVFECRDTEIKKI